MAPPERLRRCCALLALLLLLPGRQAEGLVGAALQGAGAQLQRSWGASTLFYHEELAAL